MRSLAGPPKDLIETPGPRTPGALSAPGAGDVLSEVLRTIRLTGSLQFCFMPAGDWQTDDKPDDGVFLDVSPQGGRLGDGTAADEHSQRCRIPLLDVADRHADPPGAEIQPQQTACGWEWGMGNGE